MRATRVVRLGRPSPLCKDPLARPLFAQRAPLHYNRCMALRPDQDAELRRLTVEGIRQQLTYAGPGRNAAFTHLLHGSNERCDWVIRTLFNGTALGLDNWEVLCRDRNSYSLSIPPEVNADVELVSCRELIATSKRLLEQAGRKAHW